MMKPSASAFSEAAALACPAASALTAWAAGTPSAVSDRVPASANASTANFEWDICEPLN